MISSTRKERQLLQREELILDITRQILLDRGYHGLTMDRVAEAVEYSKGTIYQHFACKEEVLTELAIRVMEKRNGLLEKAARFGGRPRERMVAIGEAAEIFVRLYPEDTRLLQIIGNEVIGQKVSESRQKRLQSAEYEGLLMMAAIMRDALDRGDLVLPPNTSVEELPFGLWAITEGGYAIALRATPLHDIGIRDPFQSVMKICDVLGDGYGWRPLTTEWDYAETRRRVRDVVLAEETRQIEARGIETPPQGS